MRATVQSRHVKKNLDGLKKRVRAQPGAPISGFLNCQNGEISFEKAQDLMPIQIRLNVGGFEMIQGDGNGSLFYSKNLAPLAFHIISETFRILNRLLPPFELEEVVQKNFVDVSRVQAEKLLKNKPEGSFLFRKDEYAQILEDELRLDYKMAIHCLTLSYVKFDHVIDQTLVCKQGRWYLFKGYLSLQKESFDSVQAMLEELGFLAF